MGEVWDINKFVLSLKNSSNVVYNAEPANFSFMFRIRYKLEPSKIHSTGIFADEDIPKDAVIWQWTEGEDHEISQTEFDQKNQEEKNKIVYYGYKSKNTGKFYFSEGDVHFINHSATGNTTELIAPNSGAGIMIARWDIKKGEELTQDYREFENEEDTRKRGIVL